MWYLLAISLLILLSIINGAQNFVSCRADKILASSRLQHQDEALALVKDAIHSNYLAVDEVQVEGPISPLSIKHINTISIDG